MRLGFSMGYAPPGTNPLELVGLARQAEGLGYDSAWAAEAWGTDAVTVLAWLAATTSRIKIGSAVLQMAGRTPANTAMTAATLDLMSGGRLLLGLGTSGPQVVEGWHGQPWGRPLERTREYVAAVRMALQRRALELHGSQLRIPYDGPGATGLGKSLQLMLRPLRAEIPLYLGALGPRQVELAFEIADGWLPLFFSPERARDAFGFRPRDGFDIAPSAMVVLTDDPAAGRDALRPTFALYLGGMGAPGKNFYNDLVRRYGYDAAADEVARSYHAGRRDEAIAAVPDTLIDEVALIGCRERIADRLDAWRESGAGTLLVQTRDPAALRTMAELVL
jgi:F420-dependent oxidoreductase-like protein